VTSFDGKNSLGGSVGTEGATFIEAAANSDDPRASDAGRALMRFFNERTNGQRLLTREDFSPVDIKPYLPNVLLTDIKYGTDGKVCDAVVRLMGSSAANFYGEYTGRSVLEHPSRSGQRFIQAVQRAVDNRCAVISHIREADPYRPFLRAVTCVVPITEDGENIVQTLVHVQLYTHLDEEFEEPTFTLHPPKL